VLVNNDIILQYNEIKASFEMSLCIVGHSFNVTLYKCLGQVISKYVLMHIVEEFDLVKHVGFDIHCGCILRCTHGYHVLVNYLDMT